MYPNQVWALASSYFDGAMIHQKGTWDLCKFHITPICAWQDCSSKQIRNARHIRTSTQMDTQKRMRRSLHTFLQTVSRTHTHTHVHTHWTLQRDPHNLQKRYANAQQDLPKRHQQAPKMPSKHSQRGKTHSKPTQILNKTTFFQSGLPWRSPQAPQNDVPRESKINQKRCSVASAYQHQLFVGFEPSENGFLGIQFRSLFISRSQACGHFS